MLFNIHVDFYPTNYERRRVSFFYVDFSLRSQPRNKTTSVLFFRHWEIPRSCLKKPTRLPYPQTVTYDLHPIVVLASKFRSSHKPDLQLDMSLATLLILALVTYSSALVRFHCSQLVTQRLDPLVNPGLIPSPHVHQYVYMKLKGLYLCGCSLTGVYIGSWVV
jgi:hypothetical protein